MVRSYLQDFHIDEKELMKKLICLALRSVADLCIIPIQDYLGLDDTARTNKPSTLGINWKWRLKEGQFDKELQEEMKQLAMLYGR